MCMAVYGFYMATKSTKKKKQRFDSVSSTKVIGCHWTKTEIVKTRETQIDRIVQNVRYILHQRKTRKKHHKIYSMSTMLQVWNTTKMKNSLAHTTIQSTSYFVQRAIKSFEPTQMRKIKWWWKKNNDNNNKIQRI